VKLEMEPFPGIQLGCSAKTAHNKIRKGRLEEVKECLWANLTKAPSAYL